MIQSGVENGLFVGFDIGSEAVHYAVLNRRQEVVYSPTLIKHFANPTAALRQAWQDICTQMDPGRIINTAFTGSGALLLKDAGARYVFESQPGYGAAPLAFEAVFDAARDADFWLNVGFASDLDSLLTMDARYAEFKAFARGSVYNYNARVTETGGSDYFESGVANPDIILKDLIRIFYPELLPEHTLYYYQKLN
jgi:ABC-type Fe3+-hydroxamate transport system substrate-binding protein